MAPAGNSALLRRFSIEKDVAGGAWLSASPVQPVAPLSSRCVRECSCSHADVVGRSPDVLVTLSEDERWSRLPRLSTLSVRVASALGHTEPQTEAREGTVATVDGVRLIACELQRSNSAAVELVALTHVPGTSSKRRLPAVEGACGGMAIELRTYPTESELLRAFETFVTAEADPDLLLTYDARCVGLIAARHAELVLGHAGRAKPPPKGKAAARAASAAGGGLSSFNLSRRAAETTKVVPIVTYGKAWQAKGGRQQTSENLETTEVVGLTGRFSCDLLRALVNHQSHKLTTYAFSQAVEEVLGEPTELVLPEVLAKVGTERLARHTLEQARQLSALCRKLKTIEETVEMARLTGLPLRTITNQVRAPASIRRRLGCLRTPAALLCVPTRR